MDTMMVSAIAFAVLFSLVAARPPIRPPGDRPPIRPPGARPPIRPPGARPPIRPPGARPRRTPLQPPPPQSPSESCTSQSTCPMDGPFYDVTITTDENFRYIKTTQCPPYNNPNRENPNSACSVEVTYNIPLHPTRPTITDSIPVGEVLESYNGTLYLKEDPKPVFGSLGVMLNGVNLFGVGSPCGHGTPCPKDDSQAPSQYVDAVESEGHTTDQCGGHSTPTGVYHLRSNLGFNNTAGQETCQLPVDTLGEHSKLLGWMFDGYGIYGQFSENGEVPTDLDECGGHTHDIDGVEVYHYHFPYPSQFPWSIGCFKGCPEVSNNPMEFSTLSQYGCQ